MKKSSLALSSRYPELDVLRFLASLAVVLMHFTYSMPRVAHIGPGFGQLGQGLRYGYLAVDLFFMISGFVVLKSARRKSLSEFFVARVTRLYPAFWLSCLLTFIGLYFGGMGGPVTVRQLLFNMTMLHEFFGYASINGVFWSLTYELSFCFLVAFIIGCRLWRHVFLVVLGWLAYTLVAGPLPGNHLFSYLFIPKHSPYFIAGMLFYLLQARAAAGWKPHAALALAFGLALRSDGAERQLAQQFYHDAPHNPVITAALIALFFLAFYAIVRRKLRLPPHPLWAGLGQLTYPLYLMHAFGAGLLGPLNGKMNKYLLLLGILALVLLVARAVHLLVERPGSRALGWKLNQLIAMGTRYPTAALRNEAAVPAK
jgi:peptidoglycan/LPS O-acetylase OafA/YrhL